MTKQRFWRLISCLCQYSMTKLWERHGLCIIINLDESYIHASHHSSLTLATLDLNTGKANVNFEREVGKLFRHCDSEMNQVLKELAEGEEYRSF